MNSFWTSGFAFFPSIKSEQSDNSNIIELFECEVCSKMFKQEKSLIKHLSTKHNIECEFVKKYPYKCKYCNKQYSKESLLNKHMQCHGKNYFSRFNFNLWNSKLNFISLFAIIQVQMVNYVTNAHVVQNISIPKRRCRNMPRRSMRIGWNATTAIKYIKKSTAKWLTFGRCTWKPALRRRSTHSYARSAERSSTHA